MQDLSAQSLFTAFSLTTWQKKNQKKNISSKGIDELREGLSREQKTAREMKKIMDSIFNNLTFEMETPEMFDGGHLPTLDFECWKENERILYSFYQKEVSKKTMIDRKY